MEKSTGSTSGGNADAGAAIATISTLSPESEARLRALVSERGQSLRVRLRAPADFDVSGHQLDAASLTLDVGDEDDTEGHTIRLHFPRVQDAKEFERRLIATGIIVGTLVIGGSGLALSQGLADTSGTPSTQAQVESMTYPGAITPATGRELTGKEEGLLRAIAGDAAETSGGQVGTPSSTADGLTGKQEGLLTLIAGDAAETGSGQVGTPSSTGDGLTGKEEGLLRAITDE